MTGRSEKTSLRVIDTETPEVSDGETTGGVNGKPGAPAVTAA